MSVVLSKIFEARNIQVVLGNFLDIESIIVSKNVFNFLGTSNFVVENNYLYDFDTIQSFLLNISLTTLESKITTFILFGFCPRIENPLFNLRLRKSFLLFGTKYYSVGSLIHSSFPVLNLGLKTQLLFLIAEGRHQFARNFFSGKTLPHILIGGAFCSIKDSNKYRSIFNYLDQSVVSYGLNYIQKSLSNLKYVLYSFINSGVTSLATAYVGSLNSQQVGTDFIYSLNSNDMEIVKKTFICYQGSHGDKTAEIADIVLPTLGVYESDSTYMSIEGLLYNTKKVINGVKSVLSHQQILEQLKKSYLNSFDSKLALYSNILRNQLYHYINLNNEERISKLASVNVEFSL